jgi:iron complex outermembrane receptor protein
LLGKYFASSLAYFFSSRSPVGTPVGRSSEFSAGLAASAKQTDDREERMAAHESHPPLSTTFPARSRLSAALLVALATAGKPVAAQIDEPSAAISDVIVVTADPNRILPNSPSASSFGFNKPLLETPRSVSIISQETIDLFGLSAVEDLVKVVPGVFTTTRFGIQGGIDVRNVPADTYFRGMKRLNLQGHGRSVLAAMDTIEVVKGPPSPVFGMGKIGGYTNMVPKAGRAAEGGYLDRPQGFASAISGSYDRAESSFGVGGPLSFPTRDGGYYVYGLAEESGTYAEQVDVGQRLMQAAMNVDGLLGDFRLETGVNYQKSTTSGALINRFDQELVDNGRYVRGSPLADLDANGNGHVGYYEMNFGSPVRGNLSAANQPLSQRFSWPRDANGNYLPLDQFPAISGIPQSMYDYLVANPDADPTGHLRAQGAGGPLPTSGFVPIGMVLDPRTVGYDTLNLRRADSFERDLEAKFLMGFVDLVNDADENFTLKNQFFYDSMDQYKLSEQPGGGKQDVHVMENKFTVTRRLPDLPEWLDINTLASANVRWTKATGFRYGGDFGSHRTDAMLGDGTMTPNSTFVHPFDNPDIANDGAPWTSNYETEYYEAGVGVLLDMTFHERTNLLVGGRYDKSRAENVDFGNTFNATTGTSANPGRPRTSDSCASGRDSGGSWSVSLSRQFLDNVRPYVTVAESSLTLENNNNKMDNSVIVAGHIGSARLREAGVKLSMLDERLFFTTSAYEQTRINVSQNDDPSVIDAEVTSTLTEGWEAEIKWVPSSNAFFSFYALQQQTEFQSVTGGGNFLVSARVLGFEDVLDANGNVVYPAEAFLYGGRAFLVMPDELASQYNVKRGNPETQLGMTAQYKLDNGLGFTLSSNHFDSVYSGRLMLVELPATTTVDVGMFLDVGRFHVKVDVLNATDERYFRARTGDTLSDSLAQAMPDRRWQATIRAQF